jgi:hypothetical protein
LLLECMITWMNCAITHPMNWGLNCHYYYYNLKKYISGVNSANFGNFLKKSPNFQHNKIQEKHWSCHSILLTYYIYCKNAQC